MAAWCRLRRSSNPAGRSAKKAASHCARFTTPRNARLLAPRPRSSHERGNMRSRGARQAGKIVATFEERDDATFGVTVGDAAHQPGEIGEVFVGQQEMPERVAGSRVESGGNEHE